MSETNDIASALAKAQGEMQHAVLDGVNPHFKSKYATLAAVLTACKSALSKHGIAVIQRSLECETGVKIETVFYHESGQSISAGIVFVPADKFNAHGLGSAMTYARRYALSTACGIAAEEDDDGNQAVQNAPKAGNTGRVPEPVAKTAAKDGGAPMTDSLREYVANINMSVFNDDPHGFYEAWDELNNDEKTTVYGELGQAERKQVRTWQSERKNEAAA